MAPDRVFVGGATTLSKKLDKTKSFQSSRNLYTALNKSPCETHYLENRGVEQL